MKARFLDMYLLAVLILLSLPAVAAAEEMPELPLAGDMAETVSVSALWRTGGSEFEHAGQVEYGLSMAAIVEAVQIAEPSSAVLVTQHAFINVPPEDLGAWQAVYAPTDGWWWAYRSDGSHRVVGPLAGVVIVAEQKGPADGLRIITPTENMAAMGIGELYIEQLRASRRRCPTAQPGLQAAADFLADGTTLDISDLLAGQNFQELILVGARGEMEAYSGGDLWLRGHGVAYRTEDGHVVVDEVRGLIVDPPKQRITDAYRDAKALLDEGNAVLLVILDGFGYHQYRYALEHGMAPFMAQLPPAAQAMAVYQPVTNAGLAAILTGVTPDENGVFSRRQRMLEAPDIFEAAHRLGMDSAYLVGDRQIVATSIAQKLHLDTDGSGTTDDNIVQSALQYMGSQAGPDLLAVHLKDIDRAGHNYGEFDGRTMQAVAEADQYLAALVEAWHGEVIITVDHGMHTTETGGDHGYLRFEDMFVPYIVTEGGRR